MTNVLNYWYHSFSLTYLFQTKVTKVDMEKLDGSGSIHDGVENVAAARDVGSARWVPSIAIFL